MGLLFSYDGGYFDKDEQGWCAHVVEVTREGDTVFVREHGDSAGRDPYESSWLAPITDEDVEAGLLILGDRGAIDLVDHRLRRSAFEELAGTLPFDRALLDGKWGPLFAIAARAFAAIGGATLDLARFTWATPTINEAGLAVTDGSLTDGETTLTAVEARNAVMAQRRVQHRGPGGLRFELAVLDWHGSPSIEWRAACDWSRVAALRRAVRPLP